MHIMSTGWWGDTPNYKEYLNVKSILIDRLYKWATKAFSWMPEHFLYILLFEQIEWTVWTIFKAFIRIDIVNIVWRVSPLHYVVLCIMFYYVCKYHTLHRWYLTKVLRGIIQLLQYACLQPLATLQSLHGIFPHLWFCCYCNIHACSMTAYDPTGLLFLNINRDLNNAWDLNFGFITNTTTCK